MRKPLFWIVLIAVFYALHQDVWFWRSARPLVFGFLPVGLAYHAAYCVAAAGLMWALTRCAWPVELDRPVDAGEGRPGPSRGTTISGSPRFKSRGELVKGRDPRR